MTTLELDNETTALLAEMAGHEHTTLAQLANRLLTECLEDWRDAQDDLEDLAAIDERKDEATLPFETALKEMGYGLLN